ncbi:MAG: hypothetical protein JO110_07820 [Acetobacteraceae bacterium]|nr:hypothetical protein [Acetobacteraceae bacterium]
MTALERITLRRVSPTFGFADVRLPGVNLCGLRVERRRDGPLIIRPPEQIDREGRSWPTYSLQPGTREAVEAAIKDLWARSGGAP